MAEVDKFLLQKRIADVEAKISEVTAQRKEIDENAKNAKTEVQVSIGNQLERLRQREVQLTRQVDALIGHQGSLLQLQLAKLYQELGRLRAAQTFGQPAQVMVFTERELCPPVAVRHLQYSSPTESDLCSAIESFGRFEAVLGSSRSSVLLLPDEEAYEDSDHQLMHKTLEDKMQWTFPKPPAKKDDWSQNMRMEDFEMSDCESIELLCPSEVQDKGFWLLNSKSSIASCTCEEKGTIEIENLANLNCNSHTKWNNKEEDLKSTLPIPDVANTCLVSQRSKCTSFRDCTCPENCLLTHLREQTKRLWLEEPQKKQDCINNTLKEAWKVDRNLWLNRAAHRNERSEWLLRSNGLKNEESDQVAVSESCLNLKAQMKELFFNTENSDWLPNKRIKCNAGWISTSTGR